MHSCAFRCSCQRLRIGTANYKEMLHKQGDRRRLKPLMNESYGLIAVMPTAAVLFSRPPPSTGVSVPREV